MFFSSFRKKVKHHIEKAQYLVPFVLVLEMPLLDIILLKKLQSKWNAWSITGLVTDKVIKT